MIWFLVLGLISVVLVLAGIGLAMRRLRIYRQETEARRARALNEMMELTLKEQGEHRVPNSD